MYAAKTIHTESSSTFSKAGLVTYDATCKSCHGENFIDEIIVTGVRFIDEVIVTGVRIDRDDGNILDTSRIPGLGGGFGGPGSIGGDYEDEEGNCAIQQKGGATKEETPCPEPEPDVCTPAVALAAQELRRALMDPDVGTREIGGLIYILDGVLGASPWERGTARHVDIYAASIPPGATIVLGWHTHPDAGAGQFFPIFFAR